MGLTYALSFLKSHAVTADDLMILEKSPNRYHELTKLRIGRIFDDLDRCLPEADLIILAVKPQDSEELFQRIRRKNRTGQIFLSIMAGVRIKTILGALGCKKVIRAMPNLPSQIREGMTVFTSTPETTREELTKIQNLLNTTGKTLYVENEDLLDSATAISGSGPAYVFYFMEALIEAAQKLGFTSPEAELLVWQTFRGTVDLFQKNDLSCEEWIGRVSSKGGTTEAAIKTYREANLHDMIIKGAEAAFQRAKELGQED